MFSINKAVWIPDIYDEIEKWKEFSQSVFCEDVEYKLNAFRSINDLLTFLVLVMTDELTEKQFDYYRCTYFY